MTESPDGPGLLPPPPRPPMRLPVLVSLPVPAPGTPGPSLAAPQRAARAGGGLVVTGPAPPAVALPPPDGPSPAHDRTVSGSTTPEEGA